MDSGFYAAAAGLRAQSQALEVVAHNLANVNTPGFRGEQTTFQSLVALPRTTVSNAFNVATNSFGVLEGTQLDLSQGTLTTTGNPLDVAIDGKGFFAVQTVRGIRYTRNGSFQVSKTGLLVSAAGEPVLGDTGPIRIPVGSTAVSPDGTVSVNGTIAGQIRVVDFPPGTLIAEGASLFSAPTGAEQRVQQVSLRQSTLESSNVDAIGSVVGLIGVQREAEMMGRVMSLFDTEFNHIAANDLGKV